MVSQDYHLHYYLSKYYDVDLFEKNSYFGGHTNTQTVTINKEKIFVDTGFIVFNTINYPNLCKLFEQLKLRVTIVICHFQSQI